MNSPILNANGEQTGVAVSAQSMSVDHAAKLLGVDLEEAPTNSVAVLMVLPTSNDGVTKQG